MGFKRARITEEELKPLDDEKFPIERHLGTMLGKIEEQGREALITYLRGHLDSYRQSGKKALLAKAGKRLLKQYQLYPLSMEDLGLTTEDLYPGQLPIAASTTRKGRQGTGNAEVETSQIPNAEETSQTHNEDVSEKTSQTPQGGIAEETPQGGKAEETPQGGSDAPPVPGSGATEEAAPSSITLAPVSNAYRRTEGLESIGIDYSDYWEAFADARRATAEKLDENRRLFVQRMDSLDSTLTSINRRMGSIERLLEELRELADDSKKESAENKQ